MKVFRILIIFSIFLSITYAGLHKDILKGNDKRAIKRIEKGKEINKVDKKTGKTPLILALEKQNHKIAKLLLENGADVKALGNDGSSTLIIATKSQDLTLLSMLLKEGVDINYKNNNEKTTLLTAIENNNIKVVQFLIDNNPDISITDIQDRNALMYAAKTGDLEMINTFLDTELDIASLDNSEKSILDYASSEAAKSLIQKRINQIAEPFINKGDKFFNKKQYEKAIEEYNKALAVHSTRAKSKIAECYYSLSKSYFNKNNFEKALELVNNAIEFGSTKATEFRNVIRKHKEMVENIRNMSPDGIVNVLNNDVSIFILMTQNNMTQNLEKKHLKSLKNTKN